MFDPTLHKLSDWLSDLDSEMARTPERDHDWLARNFIATHASLLRQAMDLVTRHSREEREALYQVHKGDLNPPEGSDPGFVDYVLDRALKPSDGFSRISHDNITVLGRVVRYAAYFKAESS